MFLHRSYIYAICGPLWAHHHHHHHQFLTKDNTLWTSFPHCTAQLLISALLWFWTLHLLAPTGALSDSVLLYIQQGAHFWDFEHFCQYICGGYKHFCQLMATFGNWWQLLVTYGNVLKNLGNFWQLLLLLLLLLLLYSFFSFSLFFSFCRSVPPEFLRLLFAETVRGYFANRWHSV